MLVLNFCVIFFVLSVHQSIILADEGYGYGYGGYVTTEAETENADEVVDTSSTERSDTPTNTEAVNVQDSSDILIPTEDLDTTKSVSFSEEEPSFEKLYVAGVKAYDEQLWYSCASRMERSIHEYKKYKSILTNCRLNCSKGLRSSKLSNLTISIPEYSSYVKFLTSADCFRRCKNESLVTHPKTTQRLENAFEKRKPYMYLQFCNYKLDRLSQAASAAYTYYLANPEDEDTTKNIVFYRDKARVPDNEFIDMEMVPYKESYIRGLIAYQNEEWKSLINFMEASLEDYWKQDEKCSADCEAHGEVNGNEFATTVGDLVISILNCRIQCEDKLSTVYTEPIPFFLRDLYHYLQFAYFKEGEFEKSAEAAETFLLFTSNHEVMKKNIDVLKNKLGTTGIDFKPRKDGAEYIKRKKEIYDFMDFIVKNYKYSDREDEVDAEEDEDTKVAMDRLEAPSSEGNEDWLTKFEQVGMHIIAKAVDLNREQRFVTDGLLKEEQCEETLSLIQDSLDLPSGAKEFNFKLSQQKLLDNPSEESETLLRQLIRAIEAVKYYLEVYLGSKITFVIKQTSIICWKLPEDPDILNDCYPQEDGSCVKFEDFPENLHEDYFTTVTYLNTVDEDGDFLFLNEKEGVDSSFGVKCGRTVGFNTNDRHRVKVPGKGTQRCALVVRYSTKRDEEEKDLHELLALLHKADELRFIKSKETPAQFLKRFEEKGVKVVKNGEDLKGKERFVADGFANDEQCETLRNVALELGVVGDGYFGVESPHTVNEMFAGLSLSRYRKSLSLLGDGYRRTSNKPFFASPHTEHELYQGITIYRANKMMHEGYIPTHGLRQFLELSETSRLFVERYFNLTRPLFFEYTHLVCRTAINGSNKDRQDLSHPVHGDNCNLQPNGTCTKDFPAYIQRDYSSLLYLNSDFEGGEFFFAYPNKTEQVTLRPRCGRLVGFNAGDLHGVKAVKSGQRCALAMWYTLNPRFKELAHIQARKTLKEKEAFDAEEKQREEL